MNNDYSPIHMRQSRGLLRRGDKVQLEALGGHPWGRLKSKYHAWCVGPRVTFKGSRRHVAKVLALLEGVPPERPAASTECGRNLNAKPEAVDRKLVQVKDVCRLCLIRSLDTEEQMGWSSKQSCEGVRKWIHSGVGA